MYILGNIHSGYSASPDDYVLSDGRVVGPFESGAARDQFGWWFASKGDRLVSAREIFEGSAFGDEYHLVNTTEYALASHPFSAINDIFVEPDNGNVVFDLPRGIKMVPPERLIFVEGIERGPSLRRLEASKPAPYWIDLEGKSQIKHIEQSFHRGQIIVAEVWSGITSDYQVGWRKDGRVTKSIDCLSRHTQLKVALEQASIFARDYISSRRIKRNRPRDTQKQDLYYWEHTFPMEYTELQSLDEAIALADRICDDLGVRRVSVKMGSGNLKTRSFFSAGEITLAATMMNNQTVIHEVAHHVIEALRLGSEASHGPHFAAVLLSLYVAYAGADMEEAKEKALHSDVVINLETLAKMDDLLERSVGRKLGM